MIFLSDIAWESLKQRPQYLAELFPDVLYVEPMTLGHKINLFKRYGNITVLSVPMLPYYARDKHLRRVAYLLGSVGFDRILSVIRRWMVPKADTYFMQNFQMVDLTEPEKTIFDYIDDAFSFTRFPKYVSSKFRQALQSKTKIATTQRLAKQIGGQVVPNGVDIKNYRKRVVYLGTISHWFDWDAVLYAAQELPELDFILIGPWEGERIGLPQNVQYAGLLSHEWVPSFLLGMDVGIIPFKKTELTASVDPVKVYEYSAAGLPTVATDFAELPSIVYRAKDKHQFVDFIRICLRRSDRREILKFAQNNTWKHRYGEICRISNLPVVPTLS